MTKEEIANIKRIDTSLNVFRKKIDSLKAKLNKLSEPILMEIQAAINEINFWQKPVIERYGKTTIELLKEVGETTAEETSEAEDSERVNPGLEKVKTMKQENPATPKESFSSEKEADIEAPSETETEKTNEPEQVEDLPDSEWPEEWN